MRKFDDVSELVNTLRPENPVYCIRPSSVKKSVEFFKNSFPGKVLYAVKTNPQEKVIKTIVNNGIQNFDVASINEIKTIRNINKSVKTPKNNKPSIFLIYLSKKRINHKTVDKYTEF